MKFFVDTADIAEIRDLAATGLVDGVTTNSLLAAKSGRHLIHVAAGNLDADAVTVPPLVLCQMFDHPLTDKGLPAFLADWRRPGSRSCNMAIL